VHSFALKRDEHPLLRRQLRASCWGGGVLVLLSFYYRSLLLHIAVAALAAIAAGEVMSTSSGVFNSEVES
jgi:hypothetical protein